MANLPQHPRGERLGAVTHLCPECGGAGLFCGVCRGAGNVSTERLARWQDNANRQLADSQREPGEPGSRGNQNEPNRIEVTPL